MGEETNPLQEVVGRLEKLENAGRRESHAQFAVWFQVAANLATVAGAVISIIALSAVSRRSLTLQGEMEDLQKRNLELQERTLQLQGENLDREYEAKAVDLLLKYDDLVLAPRQSTSERQRWLVNSGLELAESIFNIRTESKAWARTVAEMLKRHKAFIVDNRIICDAFSDAFVKFAGETLGLQRQQLCRDR